MTSLLTMLVLGAPAFGFALHLDTVPLIPNVYAQLDSPRTGSTFGDSYSVDPTVTSANLEPEGVVLPPTPPTDLPAPITTAELVKRRNRFGNVHKWLGISTWGAMTVTSTLGLIQYFNLYGMFADRDSTRCVKGTAILGQAQCSGQPFPHLLSAVATGALYFSTFGVSLAMPDPLHVGDGDGAYASKLRRHKRLRWVHLSGMIAQVVLGVLSANSARLLGIDRANDFGVQRGLATAHLAIGLTTWVTLTWAGTIML